MNAVANKGVAGAGSDKNQKILLAGLCAILVVLLVWQVPKLLGGSESSTDSTPVAAVATPVVATEAATGAQPTGTTVASTRQARRTARLIKSLPARDPFVPLIGAAAAATPVATPTPTPTPEPVAPAPVAPKVVPTAAVIWTNGRRQVIRVKQVFTVGDSTFRLLAVTRTTATIAPVIGDLEGDGKKITLRRTVPVTIENTTTGVQYVLNFSLAMSAVPTTGGN